eukprot:jgi/Psemu1/3360/gm1.3360_g
MGKRKSSSSSSSSTRCDDNGGSSPSPKTSKSSSLSAQDKIKVMDNKILAVMFEFHMDEKLDVTLTDVASQVGCQERTKSFRERWSILKNEKKWIGASNKDNGANTKGGSCFQLTKAGVEQAATPEYKEMLKELSIKPKTNEEHQARIKKYLKKAKSIAMFDFFLEYGSLLPDELVGLVGSNRRSHGYHYSWKELKDKGYIEEDPDCHEGKKKTKYRLSSKAFLNHKRDRIPEKKIDREQLAKNVKKGHDLIESRRKGDGKKSTTKEKKVKKEKGVKVEGCGKDAKAVKVKKEGVKDEENSETEELGASDVDAKEELEVSENENENENDTD